MPIDSMRSRPSSLLQRGDPNPAQTMRLGEASPFVLACDHAGNAIPQRLDGLGLAASDLERHIAYDLGALGVAQALSELLGAPLVFQRYSRLVIDSNRRPDVATSRPSFCDGTRVPANEGLGDADVRQRVEEIFWPYHEAIASLLKRRAARQQTSVLVAVHSFTPRPSLAESDRPWHIGVMFNRDPRVGKALLPLLRDESDLVVGENEPYWVDDENDYTIPVHGEGNGIPHVELEIRQDLLDTPAGQRAWAERLARLLPCAAAEAGVV